MSPAITLTIPGPPVGKQRARTFFDPRVHHVVSKTPNKTAAREAFIQAVFEQHYPGFTPLEGPVEVQIQAFVPIPVSASKKRQAAMREGLEIPTSKPDWDNLGKLVCDALEGMAYRRDQQIADGRVRKRYDDNPRMEIRISECSPNEPKGE